MNALKSLIFVASFPAFVSMIVYIKAVTPLNLI